ncbi:WD40/YVTN/BNR-like repeat-containing protein, partial [Pandoraea terrae]
MTRPRRWKLIIGALIALAATVYGYQSMTPSWETVTMTFGKSDKPYGGGAFRIRDNDVISLKIAGPELKFKPRSERKNPGVAEFSEPWMDDVNEELNRTTVSLLRGTLDGGLTRVFEQRGQTGAWWYSKDWRTQYVSTGWLDYKAPVRKDVLKPQISKLWRSQDGGKTWAQLNWPELQDIDRLLFLDPMRGYAIGWGPHVWRTTDGGQSWQEIKVPPQARNALQP